VTAPLASYRITIMRKLTMHKRSYIWWNVAGIVVFFAGFLVGSIDMATRGDAMSGGGIAMTIAAVLQVLGGGVAVVAFSLEMRRRFHAKRQDRRLSTP
jgi:hypothetical protein